MDVYRNVYTEHMINHHAIRYDQNTQQDSLGFCTNSSEEIKDNFTQTNSLHHPAWRAGVNLKQC